MSNEVAYKKSRIVRVIAKRKGNDVKDSHATGFFIAEDGTLLTCFHVVFGQELGQIRTNPRFAAIPGSDEHSRLEEFYARTISALIAELPDGTTVEAELLEFNAHYDVAALKLKDHQRVEFFALAPDDALDYDDGVFFCSYPFIIGYSPHERPFAVNSGRVSSFPHVMVGGEKYPHIQISSLNLHGNSGAPLFREGSNAVVGMVNGHMHWGSDNLAFVDDSSGSTRLTKDSLRIPLSIAFATHLKTIRENTHILKGI
jgi:S1-C subfamily serine protease